MKKRKFIALLTAILIYCSAYSQTTRATVTSGNWNTTSTWAGNVLPSSSETPVITAGHTVVYDITSATYAGVTINGTLSMTSGGNHTLISNNKNIIVNGKLNMTASSYSNFQLIQFTNITESNFVGGGETVLSTDIGLWVTDTGQLNLDGRISGGSKTHYVNATNSINSGVNSITINQTPSNWKSGDSICIAPTLDPSVGDNFILGYETKVLSSDVSSASLSLGANTVYSHPKVNNTWTAEILNLSRPLRIEGTSGGRAHVFIKSSKVQTIRDVAFRFMGPRKDRDSDGIKELVQGRYGVHFHHCEDGSRGTIVENCVMRDAGNHGFVPHGSHGVTLRNNIAYNVLETPFWWDLGHLTHDNLWDGNIVLFANYVSGSLSLPFEEEAPTFAASGFEIGIGDGNVATNNIAIGVVGDPHTGAGFDWESDNEGVWGFTHNLAHNCVGGLRVWQNTTKNHVIEDYEAYHCILGIFHGAYANSYRYINGNLYNAPIEAKAASTHSSRVRFEDYTIDAAGLDYGVTMISSPLPSAMPMLFRNCTFTNYAVGGLLDQVGSDPHSADIIQCTGSFAVDANAHASEVLRIQPTAGQATRKTKAGTTNISNFAPTIWGTGTGLTGEYYSNTNLTGLLLTRIDSYVGFSEWENGVHYSITDETYSVRWTGQVQPQFTEVDTFIVNTQGGVRLWVNDVLIIDEWEEHFNSTFKATASLTAGELYNIKLEYFNEESHTGVNLYWSSTNIKAFSPTYEYIPQSQLYPETGSFARKPVEAIVSNEQDPVSEYSVTTFVKDNVIIRSPRNTTYELYDLSGKLITRGRINAGVNYIPAGNIRPGMLLMKVDSKEMFKLIKE